MGLEYNELLGRYMMISQSIRAVYQDGYLRLLEPIDLAEGEEIRVMILTETDQVRAALGDLVVSVSEIVGDDVDVPALLNDIWTATQGIPSVSLTIVEDRLNGP
jgi:predicted DNA-binding antitoxin AbrB/MazE fold protein